MPTLNIGILAHVDAGKTSLTERLLYDTGAIDHLGSVDTGDTQTDTGEIERRRGITIRTAVAPFTVHGLQVNVVDTPGHPDFIAEVQRALAVLDGAVLVLSAVEGVQAQTRVLMRALRELGLPTLLFANKIDRAGARDESLLDDIRTKLSCRIVPMTSVDGLGTPAADSSAYSPDDAGFRARAAEILADVDDALLEDVVGGDVPAADALLAALRTQVRTGQVHPVYFGSALTGRGIEPLLDGVARLLPPARADDDGLRGTVFAIDRSAAGQKIAYVRMYAGQLSERQRITFHRREPEGGLIEHSGRITSLSVIGEPGAKRVTAGNIAKIGGLASIRVGDQIGPAGAVADQSYFPQPRLETYVRPRRPDHAGRLHAALVSLADQDPLIRTRTVPGAGVTSVLLYGEVQKEVIAAMLRHDFGVEADFEPSRAVYLERVVGTGEAVEEMGSWHGFAATVGLRVEPGRPGAGMTYSLQVELGSLPLGFHRAVEETVRQTLEQGLYGWAVQDCAVTMTRSGYSSAGSTAGDFRNLTPLVLMRALQRAGTRVHEPLDAFEVEIPADTISAVTAQLAGLEAEIEDTGVAADGADSTTWQLRGAIPARCGNAFQQRLPGLSHGEGLWWTRPGGDRLVKGVAPRRDRTDGNPLDPDGYLRYLTMR